MHVSIRLCEVFGEGDRADCYLLLLIIFQLSYHSLYFRNASLESEIFYFILSHLLYCSLFAIEALHNTPQSDNGMIKARRMPLGFAAKIYVQVGDIDRNGHAATQAGWYYKWYRGIRLLCGLEGQGEYKHRPDWERELSNTWYFDQDICCVFQEEEHGPLAREQFDSMIGTEAVDVYLFGSS